ncbi:uncharacterized protein [Palaemon carinicauda]|uniref:uncharacterized protein n=1 Tax=Palaemon carinicauda TaxID=392227 RepID=UPI0035B616F7
MTLKVTFFLAFTVAVVSTDKLPDDKIRSYPAKSSAPEYPTEPPKYSYNYGVADDYTGANFAASESREGYKTEGSYKVNLPDGRIQTVKYVDNGDGLVAEVSYEGEAKYPAYKANPRDKTAATPPPVRNPAYKPAAIPDSVYKPGPIPSREPAPDPIPVYTPAPSSSHKPDSDTGLVSVYKPAPSPSYKPETDLVPVHKAAPDPVPVYKPAPSPSYKTDSNPGLATSYKPAIAPAPVPVPVYEPVPLSTYKPTPDPDTFTIPVYTSAPAPATTYRPAPAPAPYPVPVYEPDTVPVYKPAVNPAQVYDRFPVYQQASRYKATPLYD